MVARKLHRPAPQLAPQQGSLSPTSTPRRPSPAGAL